MDIPEWTTSDEMMAGADGAPFYTGTIDPSRMNDFFNDKSMENDFDFESAASSPSPFGTAAQNMESPAMPTIKYETPSQSSPNIRRKYSKNRHSVSLFI